MNFRTIGTNAAVALVTSALFSTIFSTIFSTTAKAELVQVSYQVTASDFEDSNTNPPPAPTSTSVDGTYTFTFDTEASATEIMPDAVVGLDITDANGNLIDFDEQNSGVNTSVNPSLQEADITIGGNVSSVAFMVGISEDFRVTFKISLVDFEVLSLQEDLSFVTTVNAFYTGKTTNVTRVPEPTSLATGVAGLATLVMLSRRRRGSSDRRYGEPR